MFNVSSSGARFSFLPVNLNVITESAQKPAELKGDIVPIEAPRRHLVRPRNQKDSQQIPQRYESYQKPIDFFEGILDAEVGSTITLPDVCRLAADSLEVVEDPG